jgi:hypothetical protein
MRHHCQFFLIFPDRTLGRNAPSQWQGRATSPTAPQHRGLAELVISVVITVQARLPRKRRYPSQFFTGTSSPGSWLGFRSCGNARSSPTRASGKFGKTHASRRNRRSARAYYQARGHERADIRRAATPAHSDVGSRPRTLVQLLRQLPGGNHPGARPRVRGQDAVYPSAFAATAAFS